MKLLYITNSRIPTEKAHGFQVMKMCEAFSNVGVEVELWVPKRFNIIKEDPFHYYSISKIFTIKKISVVDLIPLYRIFGAFANLIESFSFAVFAVSKLPKDNDYIIYSRDQFILWFLSFTNKKFVYEIHSFPGHPIFYRKIWNHAYKIVTITSALKNKIANIGIDESKIIVARDAVDLAVFDAVTQEKNDLKIELGLAQDNFLVGYIGKFKTLGMEKGIKTMIESLSVLNKSTQMIFVGGEEIEVKEYKTMANRFNVLPQCVFIGYKPYASLVKYIKAMDALVIPFPNRPHYAFYASPLKLFEYMASGRPIIASDLPALREVLNDKSALFFKPENAADLARAIKMLKSSQTLGYHLSRQALSDVKEYTWSNRAKKILEFIK